MRSKKEILDQLVNDPLYKSAVLSSTEEDRKRIEATLQPLFVDLMSSMDLFIEQIKADPEAQAELARGLSKNRIVVNNEPSITGSTG